MTARSTLISSLIAAGALATTLTIAQVSKPADNKNAAKPLDNKAPITVNIDNPEFRKLSVALPAFFVKSVQGGSLAAEFSKEGPEELAYLLQFSGLFNVVSPNAYNDTLDKIRQERMKVESGSVMADPKKAGMAGVDIPQWRTLGIESLTLGDVDVEKSGNLTLTIMTIDVTKGEPIIARRYSNIQKSDLKAVMRKYGDAILKAYTGKPGIFNSKLVFIGKKSANADKQVFISDFDGSNAQQITHEKTVHVSPKLSPDLRYITFTSYEQNNPDLYIYDVAKGTKRKLSAKPGINSGGAWAPNGKLIAFTGSTNANTDLYTIQPDGKADRVRLISGDSVDVDPAFSPNGSQLAWVSGRFKNPHIFVADLSWTGETQVKAVGDKRLTYAGWWNATPSWSPEGDKITFAGFDKDINRWDLFMMNPDGTKLERLTLKAGDNENPTWSPNGQLIIFSSSRGSKGNDIKGSPQLYVMNRDGSGQRPLNTGLYWAQTPFWSKNIE